jgi:hypothetical protein
LLIAAVLCAASRRAGANVTPQQVDAAIKKGVAYLYAQQNDKGNWEISAGPGPNPRVDPANNDPAQGQWGGLTALATYSLLVADESWKDKRLREPIEWMAKAQMIGVYAVGLRAQAWQFLPQTAGVKAAAKLDAGMLMAGMKRGGDARAMWHYFVNDGAEIRYDHSVSQIALLGVWACQQAGREVPTAFWAESERAWRAHQNPDGSWAYRYKENDGKHGPNITMTAAGVATLFMAEDYVHMADGVACKGNVFDDALVRGTRWIEGNAAGLPMTGNVGYTYYGLERVALASGYKYFGTFDWYKNASEALVNSQAADGSWSGDRGGPVVSTAWAVIVLCRGRAPIIMNKFEYDLDGPPKARPAVVVAAPKPPAPRPVARPTPARPGVKARPPAPVVVPPAPVAPVIDPNATTHLGNWCQRPRDVAQFTRWMTDVTERKLGWQVIGSKNAVDDWHDAPVLYISGNQKLNLPKETVDKLRQYAEEGGLIYGQADCGSKEFTDSFVELGKALFPMYEFRELPADHPIYTRQQFLRTNWKNPPSVLGLSNGARELMVTIPNADFGRNWQTMAYLGKEESFQAMNGIVLYAVDRQKLRYRGASYVIRPTQAGGRAVKVARLEFAGNWDPEPAGWRRLAALLGNQSQANVTVETVKLGEGRLDGAVYPIAHLTGTGQFAFTKDQIAELRKFVIKGGTIVCDAAGGDGVFAGCAEQQLALIISGSKFEPLNPDDPALAMPPGGESASASAPMLVKPIELDPTGAGANSTAATRPTTNGILPDVEKDPPAADPAGEPVKTLLPPDFPVEYRAFAKLRLGTSQALRLKGVKFRKKWAIIYSAEDLSVGMVGQNVDGIHGYAPTTATEIMRRLTLNLTAPPSADAPK